MFLFYFSLKEVQPTLARVILFKFLKQKEKGKYYVLEFRFQNKEPFVCFVVLVKRSFKDSSKSEL